MKKTNYEIYLSFSKRPKKYVVANFGSTSGPEVLKYCKRLFKCSEKHIKITLAYINKDELYFDDPDKSGTRMVYVGFYVR